MNCSETEGLRTLLSKLLQGLELQGKAVPHQQHKNGSSGKHEGEGDEAYLYILLIMIFYACLAGALILAYTRSRKQESKHDPYHLYIEREWNEAGPGGMNRTEVDEPPAREQQLLGAAALPPTRAC
ncbi:potassium voltage-gated channel subfamily E regulatory beta subunit 5 [Microcaecilia unicolor]|uniref:Potassium voltage-gated channel subfamily E regulatory beta subunit 5 n=1 Tax=Microcaecilia unicolor TaxID=1415580 RepID=A0A6P7YD95_9AMPH|nr:potassium voltage-gated channel subfamily E regulatory beta subunit 5 [Microcaecilia unicolor]